MGLTRQGFAKEARFESAVDPTQGNILNTLSHIRRFDTWFRGLLVLYLLSTLFLAAEHQHHRLQTDNCALCTISHTPATVASSVDHQTAPANTEYVLAITADQGWESQSHRTTRSRAPPLV